VFSGSFNPFQAVKQLLAALGFLGARPGSKTPDKFFGAGNMLLLGRVFSGGPLEPFGP
jgi:hypothetical protein